MLEGSFQPNLNLNLSLSLSLLLHSSNLTMAPVFLEKVSGLSHPEGVGMSVRPPPPLTS